MGLQTVQLSKSYRGGVRALEGVDLEVESGVLAVLGPEGAGKSTLAAIVATLERPEVRRRIGYVPQDARLFPQLTVQETLDYLALIHGMDHAPARQLRVSRALERFDLASLAAVRIGELPAGLVRRVALAQACLA